MSAAAKPAVQFTTEYLIRLRMREIDKGRSDGPMVWIRWEGRSVMGAADSVARWCAGEVPASCIAHATDEESAAWLAGYCAAKSR